MTNGPWHTPLMDMLRAAQGRTRMHMPGHKGNLPPEVLPPAFDMTELPITDDLFAPESGIAQAEALAATSAGAAHTLMLAGGATAGVLAMVLANVAPGGTLIVARDCHHSVLSACVWGDIQPLFLPAAPDGEAVRRMIAAHPEACAVLLTRPDYAGRCGDILPVVQAVHGAGMRLLVDEAHGAHLSWQVPGLPLGAGACGADAWVQSAHKTLPALTGAAWLHLSDRQDPEAVRAMLRMVHTSSPSFLILASLDYARAWMDVQGRPALTALMERVEDFWRRLSVAPGFHRVHAQGADLWDPTRIYIDTTGHGYSGQAVADRLALAGVDVEMADAQGVLLLPSVMDPPEALDQVARALLALPAMFALTPDACGSIAQTMPEVCLRVRQAALGPQGWVPLADAVGRIAARSAGLYPPGVPLVVPGERIPAWVVKTLGRGNAFGVCRGCLRCVAQPT